MKSIPQYFDAPVPMERLVDKAKSGSYKAAEYLQSLLQFTATAVLGGDPFTDLSVKAMEEQLRAAYHKEVDADPGQPNVIAMATKLAWPDMEGGWIEFDGNELVAAAEGLCRLLAVQPAETVVSHLVGHYLTEEADADDFAELGSSLRRLGIPRDLITRVATTAGLARETIGAMAGS